MHFVNASCLCPILLLFASPLAMCDVYSEAFSKGLVFFEAQRSGKLPADNRKPWRGDSCLANGLDVGLDLSRAYFDLGDHVVFGLPLSFTSSTRDSYSANCLAAKLRDSCAISAGKSYVFFFGCTDVLPRARRRFGVVGTKLGRECSNRGANLAE
jgi:hypothetical protein